MSEVRGGWQGLMVFNLCLGVLLWLGLWTDYSWTGTYSDYAFPVLVLLAALTSLLIAVKRLVGKARRKFTLACTPSLLAGGMACLTMLLMIFPPFILSTSFLFSEIESEKLIQRSVSPDGRRVAEVYFRPVGAYSGGNGRTFIRVGHVALPIIERDVFSNPRSDESGLPNEYYIEWKDNDTLRVSSDGGEIPELKRTLKLGWVRFTIPKPILLALVLLGLRE